MNERVDERLSECHDCGLIQQLPRAPSSAVSIVCQRCEATLRQVRPRSVLFCSACAGLGLGLYVLAFFLPTASVTMGGGRSAVGELVNGPQRLNQTGAWELALVVVFTLIVLPLAKLVVVLTMGIALKVGRVPPLLKRSFTSLPFLTEWGMIDVFLLGSMIALFRLRDWMTVSFGESLFALGGAALCSLGIDAAFDRSAFWRSVPHAVDKAKTPLNAGFLGCLSCGLVSRIQEAKPCPRCQGVVHARQPDSIRRTWAFVISAALVAIPANVLPVMTITKLGRGDPSTILGGTLELQQAGFWGLALLVFVASILVPLFKLGALCSLLVMTQRGSSRRLLLRTRVYRAVTVVGRWSMLDIFATMTLVEMARFGWLGNVLPGLGAAAFCAVVLLTLLASHYFDPRLMWDAAGKNSGNALAASVSGAPS